ncbi:hypothetical protein ACIRUL_32325 [Streptomyces sp. NPDC101171]|uniref:hypothetical protein n=1 Tax=Streptomyces sp. NPDC101171 TaxID=3366122 RepID=UPI0038135ECC
MSTNSAPQVPNRSVSSITIVILVSLVASLGAALLMMVLGDTPRGILGSSGLVLISVFGAGMKVLDHTKQNA